MTPLKQRSGPLRRNGIVTNVSKRSNERSAQLHRTARHVTRFGSILISHYRLSPASSPAKPPSFYLVLSLLRHKTLQPPTQRISKVLPTHRAPRKGRPKIKTMLRALHHIPKDHLPRRRLPALRRLLKQLRMRCEALG
jgi:hypothetical protein